MREGDRLPRFNRYSIPPRDGTIQCAHCPAWVKPGRGLADHLRAKHPELVAGHSLNRVLGPELFDL